MTLRQILITIVGSALTGMLMGGFFGFASGTITPDFFGHLIPWQDVKPVGFASFLGATAGVILGGGMGCFAILVRVVLLWRSKAAASEASSPGSAAKI